MEDPRREFQVRPVRTRSDGRLLPVATFLVGLLLGAALIKPWDLVFPPSAPAAEAPGAVVASTSPKAEITPSPTPGVASECAFAGGWRVFALGQRDALGGDGSSVISGRTAGPSATFDIANPLRRWLEIVPAATASGPDDPSIPFVAIFSGRIAGIGYCPPSDGSDDPPGLSTLSAWLRDDGSGGPATELSLTPLDAAPRIEVEVYAAPSAASSDAPATDAGTWPAGRYVVAIAGTGVYRRWFGVEIRLPPGRPVE
jgi:hypothetical protein